jgi:cytochrome c peroxidase
MAAVLMAGCGSELGGYEDVVTTPHELDLPAHFPDFDVPADNPTTEEGVALGRRLYYDPMLSEGGPLEGAACASCHQQEKSFASNAPGLSVMSHVNHNWTTHFLWNGKIEGTLEDVMHFEVTQFFEANIELFRSDPTYRQMSHDAFGTRNISEVEMSRALAQWMRTLVSYRSKYDRYMVGEVELTALEARGKELYETTADCASCHALPLTTDNQFHDNGVVGFVPTKELDLGRYNVTGDWEDYRSFKTPTLRNIELTAPYMHDGRFATLEEVIEHYNSGVHSTSTLSEVMRGHNEDEVYGYALHLSEGDKKALLAFLKTFTDDALITDPELSSPFD